MINLIECESPDKLTEFYHIICKHIGLRVPDNEWETLEQILYERVNALQTSVQLYFMLLEATEAESDQEWALLANRLRVGESYFFRDSGQMALLETDILPELLRRNAATHSLRIFSAGCSTGEEAYSIAMLLDRIIPSWDTWNITIVGVDIDAVAIEAAQRGLYTEWSLRRVLDDTRNVYFEQQGSAWQISSRVRTRVEFLCVNLVKHNLPAEHLGIANVDLIICRNVFIYFRQDIINKLVDKFVNTLVPGGYLMTGHGELYGVRHPMLEVRLFAASVVYQRLAVERLLTSQSVATLPVAKPPVTRPKITKPKPTINTIKELTDMLQQGHYNRIIAIGALLAKKLPREPKIWLLLAQAHVGLSQYTQAEACCTRLLEIDTFSAPAYLILARIARETGAIVQRLELLKKALYLDHNFIIALLELAEIYANNDNADRAKKMRETACRVLSLLPENAIVDMSGGQTAGNLLAQVHKLL